MVLTIIMVFLTILTRKQQMHEKVEDTDRETDRETEIGRERKKEGDK